MSSFGVFSRIGGGCFRDPLCLCVCVCVVVMGISNVQHVSKAAAERLTAKFGDLCDPHELMKHQSRRMRISQLASKSRQATKTIRQMRLREKTFDEVGTCPLGLSRPDSVR